MLTTSAFKTARLSYRALDAADKDFIHSMWSDAPTAFGAMGSAVAPYGKDKAEDMAKKLKDFKLSIVAYLTPQPGSNAEKEETVGWFALVEPYPGAPSRRAQLGVSIHPSYQGKGYAKEACEYVLETGFLRFGFNRIECEVFAWNEPAVKLYKGLGFVQEGMKRQSLFQEGEFRDEYIFGLLASEWRAAHQDKLKPNTSKAVDL